MSPTKKLDDEPLWPHKVRFDAALRGLKVTLSADTERRAAIAAAFGMVSLERLEVSIETRAVAGQVPMVRVKLTLEGEVTQECGVTLEPFSQVLSGELQLDCIEAARVTRDVVAAVGERELGLGDLDEPDVIADGQIDLGQYAIEALGEAYDPFARKPGVAFEEPEAEAEPSPFAILAKLQKGE